MQPFIFLVALSLLGARQAQNLNPALLPTPGSIEKCWALGEDAAAKKKTLQEIPVPFTKNFGNTKNAPRHVRYASEVSVETPEWVAFVLGWNMRRQYLPEADIAKEKEGVLKLASEERKSLSFSGMLTAWPQTDRRGNISLRAEPDDLANVRIVLKVGEKIYQPVSQPGTLAYKADTGVNRTRESHSSGSVVTATGPGGTYTGSATNYYTIGREERYEYYRGHFAVDFDLFNADGTARIGPGDKAFSLILVYGRSEDQVTFDLAALDKMRR